MERELLCVEQIANNLMSCIKGGAVQSRPQWLNGICQMQRAMGGGGLIFARLQSFDQRNKSVNAE
jgi:hypothetical protein